ncbi:HpcH/HpaI aldolase/citrate lyase family protein [Aureimonas sp. AU20]|uniref:HpcH/HpaI aldolase family protein n=1 Tax=Aureimonas sp. AU20 TaxID=1349819 RepID=UPI000B089E68|nr:aldolase/citrate lyase family protein [Aureimonas sp. AU20]
MTVGKLREMLGSPDVALSAWAGLGDPVVHEALLAAFDVITFDVQHGLQSIEEIREGCARAVFLGKPALVRVPIGDLALAGRVLDFGATGVILPMVDNAAEAERFARALRYPPLGMRSFGPARALSLFGMNSAEAYIEEANKGIVSLAMIETAGAFREIDAILAVPELGGVFVGPSDLSLALGGKLDPNGSASDEAAHLICRQAKSAGKIAAVYAANAADARRYRDMGYDLICVASDIGLLKQASLAICAEIRRKD